MVKVHTKQARTDFNVVRFEKYLDKTPKIKAVNDKGEIILGRTFKNLGSKIENKLIRILGLIQGKGWVNNAKVEKKIEAEVAILMNNINDIGSLRSDEKEKLHNFIKDLSRIATTISNKCDGDASILKFLYTDLESLDESITKMKSKDDAPKTPLEILGLTEKSSIAERKKKYLELARKCHPDKIRPDEKAGETTNSPSFIDRKKAAHKQFQELEGAKRELEI